MPQMLSVWEDPPEFKHVLFANLIPLLGCSITTAVIGSRLLSSPHALIGPYLEDTSGDEGGTTSLQVCRDGAVDLCPTGSGLETARVLPEDWLELLSVFVFVIGVVNIVMSLITSFAALTANIKILFLTLIFNPFMIASEWKLIDLINFEGSPAHEQAKSLMLQSYDEGYQLNSVNDVTRALNSLMVTFGCCGIREPADFAITETGVFDSSRNITLYFEYPPACCVRPNYHYPQPISLLESVHGGQCVNTEATWDISKQGCFSVLFNSIYDQIGRRLSIVILCMIGLQSLQSIFTIFVLLKPRLRHEIAKVTSNPSTFISLASERAKSRSQIIRKGDESTCIA